MLVRRYSLWLIAYTGVAPFSTDLNQNKYIMNGLTYSEKKKIANTYLNKICGLEWDDLADVNSLHDCENIEDIEASCDQRLEESGFPILGEDEEY